MDDIFADEDWVPEDVYENQRSYRKKYFFPIPRVDMETQPPDKASIDPLVATNVRVEEDRVRLDGTSSKEE